MSAETLGGWGSAYPCPRSSMNIALCVVGSRTTKAAHGNAESWSRRWRLSAEEDNFASAQGSRISKINLQSVASFRADVMRATQSTREIMGACWWTRPEFRPAKQAPAAHVSLAGRLTSSASPFAVPVWSLPRQQASSAMSLVSALRAGRSRTLPSTTPAVTVQTRGYAAPPAKNAKKTSGACRPCAGLAAQ